MSICKLHMHLGRIGSTICLSSLALRRHDLLFQSLWRIKPSLIQRFCRHKDCRNSPGTAIARMGLEAGRERPDGAWFAAGVLLTAGGLAPSLAACFHAEQVLTMDPLQRLGLFLATDGLFAVTSYGFLLLGETFGRERLEGRAAEAYPGPWKEPSGARIMPKYFRPYLLVLPAFVGLLIPAATTAGSLLWTEHGILAATCLTTYLATLLSQIWMETAFIKRGSFMWPMVPVVHMIYRLWQLGRGSVLVAALHGPVFLQYLQACLVVIWVLNFGAVMAWMPWLYRWHLQPKAARE